MFRQGGEAGVGLRPFRVAGAFSICFLRRLIPARVEKILPDQCDTTHERIWVAASPRSKSNAICCATEARPSCSHPFSCRLTSALPPRKFRARNNQRAGKTESRSFRLSFLSSLRAAAFRSGVTPGFQAAFLWPPPAALPSASHSDHRIDVGAERLRLQCLRQTDPAVGIDEPGVNRLPVRSHTRASPALSRGPPPRSSRRGKDRPLLDGLAGRGKMRAFVNA